jgi:dihydroflavonol-4-reductase
MPILVTGATGLLGNNIVRLLLDQGQAVRVLVRAGADPRPLEGLDVETCEGDVRDPESVRRSCRGATAVIHSAGLVKIGWTRLQEAREINVGGTENVARAAREAGLRMVHVSTVNTLAVLRNGDLADEQMPPQNNVPCSYVVTKQAAERALLDEVQRGLDGLIVHPGFMVGPWDWKPSSGEMLLEVAAKYTPFAPRGGVAVCDPRDVAAATIAAITRGRTGERYILGGNNTSYYRLWRTFSKVAGKRIRPFFLMPGVMGLAGGAFGDALAKVTGREGNVNSAAIRMAKQLHYYSSAKAEAELGFRARDVEESTRDAWEWFLEHGYVKRHRSREAPPRSAAATSPARTP